MKILFLGANGIDTSRLRIGAEFRDVRAEIERVRSSNEIEFRVELAVTPVDLNRLLLDYKPDIVHFSGHGTLVHVEVTPQSSTTREFDPPDEQSAILLETREGQAVQVSAEALARLFGILKTQRCVVLNACFSAAQAEAIAAHVDCVIGMKHAIDDQSAVVFAVGFYQAIARGQTVKTAFDLGCSLISTCGRPDADVPELRGRVDPGTVRLVDAGVPTSAIDAVARDGQLFHPISPKSERHSMLRRFVGDDGRRRLEEALLEQVIVKHSQQIAHDLAKSAKLRKYEQGESVIAQGDTDTDLCFILVGAVSVEINGREVAKRRAGEHFGELGVIDASAKRNATARAVEETVIARIDEPTFSTLANRNPEMWRRISLDLGKRLRERGYSVKPVNNKPVVFIGSTVERLPIARAIQAACQYDTWNIRLWTDGVLGAGKTPIEALTSQLDSLDFGLFVVTADDVVESRGSRSPTTRDNVLFELGLIVGGLGRERAFMVRLREERDLKLPTDLLGIKALEIAPGSEVDLPSRVGPAVNELRTIITRLQCK